jgi:dTDP-4-dehydrorhamnose 3,5-epimerase
MSPAVNPADLSVSPVPDHQTVTAEGLRLDAGIEGVEVRWATTHSDERGSLTEIFNPAWDFSDEPLVYVYQSTVHVGQKKGWVVHLEQTDRLFFAHGTAKVVLYDARRSSPTHGVVQELFLGEVNRGLIKVPPGVVHAVANVGPGELRFVNLPTRPYRHDSPDKLRLPFDTDEIPYRL